MSLRPLPFSPIVWMLLAGILPMAAWGAEGDAEPAGETSGAGLRFRRVIAPADRVQDWPLGSGKYIPVQPAEFERLLSLVRNTASGQGPGARGQGRVVSARYQGRVEGDELITGRASLQIQHAAEGPILLPLDPCGLAIGNANWTDAQQPDDGQPGNGPTEATLGLGPRGKLEVLVQRSGRLEFDWSLAGSRDAAGVVSFELELPPCPTNRLILDVPQELTPVAERGVVFEAGEVIETGAAGEGFRRWQIELGGYRQCRLRLMPAAGGGSRKGEGGREKGEGDPSRPSPLASRPSPLALLRESVVYDFSPHGVDVTVRLNLEVQHEPLQQITLALDGELQLVGAQYGDLPVRRTIISH